MLEIRVPEAGESISQVELARWLVSDGDYIEKDQEIAEIDSDKATLTINAPESGRIRIMLEEGSTTEPGKIIGEIDASAAAPEVPKTEKKAGSASVNDPGNKDEAKKTDTEKVRDHEEAAGTDPLISPAARKLLDESGLSDRLSRIRKPDSRRITRHDVMEAISLAARSSDKALPADDQSTDSGPSLKGGRDEERQKMSTLRRKVSERLVAVKNQTAMLTTFNEADMSALMALRREHQEAFLNKYGLKLGFMSFFARAVALAIPYFPTVNARIEDQQIVIPSYADIGIAVSTPKGLMVPVIRNAEAMGIAELEKQIQQMAAKAREGRISIEDLSGGTISITNGGVFGSMMSTPILNPPQSAILGMHNIIERPVARDGQVVIRPMMYLALSYDHRIIDGKESVGFLVRIKEMIENPTRMLTLGEDPAKRLLGI